MPSELNRTFVIKNHLLEDDLPVTNFTSIIFLVRNPYNAYIADFNRIYSEGQNHVGYAKENAFDKSNAAFTHAGLTTS